MPETCGVCVVCKAPGVPGGAVTVWQAASSPWLTAEGSSQALGYAVLERHRLGGLKTHTHKSKISPRHLNYTNLAPKVLGGVCCSDI